MYDWSDDNWRSYSMRIWEHIPTLHGHSIYEKYACCSSNACSGIIQKVSKEQNTFLKRWESTSPVQLALHAVSRALFLEIARISFARDWVGVSDIYEVSPIISTPSCLWQKKSSSSLLTLLNLFSLLPFTKHVAFLSCSKSQSLTNAFSFTESSFFRSSVNEDEAKAETIRNLRKSFASLFSD